jgi:hypothetical protein
MNNGENTEFRNPFSRLRPCPPGSPSPPVKGMSMAGTSFAFGTSKHDVPLLASIGGGLPLDLNSWVFGSETNGTQLSGENGGVVF